VRRKQDNHSHKLIAGTFFIRARSKYGDVTWKSGCSTDGLPEPEFTVFPSIFSIFFPIRNNRKEQNDNYHINFGINETQMKI